MIGRTVYLLAFLVSIAFIADASFTKANEVIAGRRQTGDHFYMRQSVTEDSKWLRKVVVERTLNAERFHVITMVRLVDKSTDGKGAIGEVVGGGPGFDFVNILIKSRRGYGIKYDIEIYTMPA